MAKRIEFKLDGEDYLELGDAALQKGEYEKAISYFRTACSASDDSESYTALGVAYSKLHELDASNAALYKAMTRALTDEDENPALWQLCLNAAEAGEEDVASYYLRYLGEDDGAAEIRRVPSGEGMFKIADKPAVEFCKTMLQRAGEAFADERPDDAIRYLDELGDAPEPYLTMAQRLRTVCLFAKGDLDRVISVCEEIEKKSPDADNKVTLAAANCFQGRYDDVDRVLDEVLAADDIPEYVTLKLLHLLVERQRDADILQITEKLSRHARLWHASEMFRSEALYNLGKRQEAVRVMKRVDNVFGEFSAAHYYLGIYEGEPEKVPYGCEMPQECQLAIVRGIKQITDGGDVTRLQRALTYDAAFNRDLRWVIDNCADIIACPVLMYLSDIRSRAVEKIFRDRLIGVRLSFDQMTLIIDYLVGGGLSVQFDIVAQGRFKNVDFRLPACFRALPKKFKSAVYRTACDIVFTDEDPTYYLDRLCAIVEDLVTADAHGEPVWKRRSGRKIAKLRSEVTMIGVLLSEVYRDDPDPDEDAMERYELSPRTFYKYRAIFFGDDDARVRDDGGEEEDDED